MRSEKSFFKWNDFQSNIECVKFIFIQKIRKLQTLKILMAK